MNFTIYNRRRIARQGLVAIIEGLPAGVKIDLEKINHELWRRQQGYGRGGRMKIESDKAEILSGIRHGKTLGSPVTLMIENRDFVHWTEIMSAETIPKLSRKIRASSNVHVPDTPILRADKSFDTEIYATFSNALRHAKLPRGLLAARLQNNYSKISALKFDQPRHKTR